MLLEKVKEFTVDQPRPIPLCFYGKSKSGKSTLMNNILHEMHNNDQIDQIYCIKLTPNQESIRDKLKAQYPNSGVSDLVIDVTPKEEELINGMIPYSSVDKFIRKLNSNKTIVIIKNMNHFVHNSKNFERSLYLRLTKHLKETGVSLWVTETNNDMQILIDVHTVMSKFLFLCNVDSEGKYDIDIRTTSDGHSPGVYSGVRLMDNGDIDYD